MADLFFLNFISIYLKQFNNFWFIDGKCKPFPKEGVEQLYSDNYAYEVVRLINGNPLFLELHFNRLLNTCAGSCGDIPPNLQLLKKEIAVLVEKEELSNINLKIIVSNERRAVFAIPSVYPTKEQYSHGVKCNFLHEERENPKLKIFQADLRKKVDKKKQEVGVFESILVNKQGLITEGSKSNIFFLKGNELFTAPDSLILSGITRQKIIEICKSFSIKVNFEAIHFQNGNTYEAAFICGTSPGVLPINAIEGAAFQMKHAVLLKIHHAFHKLMKL